MGPGEDDAYAQGVTVLQRLRGDQEAAMRPGEVARDERHRAAPSGDGDFDFWSGDETQHAVQ